MLSRAPVLSFVTSANAPDCSLTNAARLPGPCKGCSKLPSETVQVNPPSTEKDCSMPPIAPFSRRESIQSVPSLFSTTEASVYVFVGFV